MADTANEFWKTYPPRIEITKGNPEAEKYGKMWARPEYRAVAPGEDLAELFLNLAQPGPGDDVVDFGCGTGRGGAALAEHGKMRVTLVDFVRNCLDEKVRELIAARPEQIRFVKHDLEVELPMTAKFGYCTDVMEHVPEARVPLVLRNVLGAAQHVFFSISTAEDKCGDLIGERLHMTVQKYRWWLEQFARLDCVVQWSKDLGSSALFYVTAWVTPQAVVDAGFPNTTDEQVVRNVRANVAAGWEQMAPAESGRAERWKGDGPAEVMVLGGGPSLSEHEGEIRANREAGMPMVTLNGAYNWAVERGIMPSATVVVDARPFNVRFVRPVVDGCKYLICSQVDPSVLDGRRGWSVGRGHGPDLQTMLSISLPDGRKFGNGRSTVLWGTEAEARAIHEAMPDRDHWEVFEFQENSLPKDRTLLWHTTNAAVDAVLREMLPVSWRVTGGSTVLLRVVPLLGALGFHRLHLYGCDSCIPDGRGGAQHAYAQQENEGTTTDGPFSVTVGGRTFWCKTWMISQAQEFIGLVAAVGDQFELEVHGDGLLRHILVTAAALADLEVDKGLDEIVPGLFLGGADQEQVAMDMGLVNFNVRHIRGPKDDAWYPILVGNHRANLDSAAESIDTYLKGGRGVYVHCLIGKERGPLTVAWYLHTRRGMTLDAAYALVKEKHPLAEDRRGWIDGANLQGEISTESPTGSVVE